MKRALVLFTILALAGCAADTGGSLSAGPEPGGRCSGKCDGWNDAPTFVADLEKLNATWPGEAPVESVEDAFRVRVDLGEHQLVADTHLFGVPVNVIPYHNDDGVTDADGQPIARGDAIIAGYFPPGEIGIGVKHHRPEHRVLSLAGADPTTMKEHFKLQDTHIEVVVGVERDGEPGAITLNNPQTYERGRFGSAGYPMIFLRPVYPEWLTADQEAAFRDNIRTMLAGFNAVSEFPGDYNGGDPLGARDPDEVRRHAAMMVRAIAGDAEARAWFREDENKIYCAELAHVSFSAGLVAPLNARTFVPVVGEETWAAFVAEVDKHEAGEPSAFTELNDNELVSLVDLALAPEDLEPAAAYAPAGSDAAERLAFQPMTMADIVQQFMATHLPRRELGESVAPLQGAVLAQMKPGLLETMGMDELPAGDPRRVAVEELFDAIVEVVGTPHESYAAFREALAPLMAQARAVTGPRDGSGNGLFVPPSLMHVIAQGRHPGGLLGLSYVGHGLHWSMVRPEGGNDTDTDTETDTDTDTDTDTEPEPETEPDGGPQVLLEQTGTLARGEERRFTVTVPEGASTVRFELTAEGDPDLYVRRGEAPTAEAYDCRPYEPADTDERCEHDEAGGAVFHALVRGYGASSFGLVVTAE